MGQLKAINCGVARVQETPLFSIKLIGPFQLKDAQDVELTLRMRKSKALLAALSVAPTGRRGRAWLQALLWSERGQQQAAASLRQCTYEIRKAMEPHQDCLICTHDYIELDLRRVHIDAQAGNESEWDQNEIAHSEFLEGLDVGDPEFDDWLRDQRRMWSDTVSQRKNMLPAQAQTTVPNNAALPLAQNWSLALAVMPLQNHTNDPALQFVGEGLSEDLINRLQRIRWLPVIARASSFSGDGPDRYSGDGAFSQGLGALYAIDGAIFQSDNDLRVRLRLIATDTGQMLWSDTIDFPQMTTPEVLNQVLDEIVAAIDRTVSNSYQARSMTEGGNGHDFLNHIWRGRWHLARLTVEDSNEARNHFEMALELRPQSSEALIQLGFWHLWRAWASRGDADMIEEGARLARRANLSDPEDGRCFALLGIADSWRRQHSSAIEILHRAIELTPSLSIAHHQLGSAYCLDDQPDKAVAPLKAAMRYSPRDQLDFTYQTEMAVVSLRQGKPDAAWAYATTALAQKPRYWYAHLVRILAAQHANDSERTAQARAAFHNSGAKITKQHYEWLPFRTGSWQQELSSLIKTLE